MRWCHLQQHWWTWRLLCWVGWVRQRGTSIVWCQLCAESRKKIIQMNLFAGQKRTHGLREWTYGCQRGWGGGSKEGRDGLGVWDWHVHAAIYKMDKQQGPTVEHRELCSVLCNNLNGKRIWKRIDIHVYTCICITESLCCTPETGTTLLINSTPI